MKDSSSAPSALRPYKGPESYQRQDADLFFGREREAEHLLGLIRSSRTTLLYAPSGAGKTSLLNARIIPRLESGGWLAMRIRPGHNPLRATREAVLTSCVMHPELEADVLRQAHDALAAPGEALSIQETIRRFAELPISDPRKRTIVASRPVSVQATGITVAESSEGTPFTARLLTSAITVEQFRTYLTTVTGGGGGEPSAASRVSPQTPVAELLDLLSSEHAARGHEATIERLAAPVHSMADFFKHVYRVIGPIQRELSLALIFDQFEEIFTLFVDPGPGIDPTSQGQHDWRLRWRFFEELEDLYQVRLSHVFNRPGAESALDPLLPVRFLFSLRQEYLAELEPLKEIVPNLDSSGFKLGLLSLQEAEKAIRQPAIHYGCDYSPECYEKILSELAKEERFVEPSHIQIVCEKLWNEYGATLVRERPTDASSNGHRIHLAQFEALKGSEGILRSYFSEFIEELTEEDQIESLEMMGTLITAGRTRNIVDRGSLIGAPFKDPAKRPALLERLVDRRILRVEPRLGGYFVEITHEFLLGPVLEHIARKLTANHDYRRYHAALQLLERHVNLGFGSRTDLLPTLEDFELLHSQRGRIWWSPRLVELMLRTAIARGSSREKLKTWLDTYGTPIHPAELLKIALEHLDSAAVTRRELDHPDWQILASSSESVPGSPDASVIMLRSTLRWAADRDFESIVFWTRRVQSHVH